MGLTIPGRKRLYDFANPPSDSPRATHCRGLRERDAGRDELESNRLELARRQRQLSRALVERHLRQDKREAA